MATDQEPTYTVKLLQLLLLSTYWGMQIWVTFISSRCHTQTGYLSHQETNVNSKRSKVLFIQADFIITCREQRMYG